MKYNIIIYYYNRMSIPPPQTIGMPAGSPRESALLTMKGNGELLNKLNQIGKGKGKRRVGGGQINLNVPVVTPMYKETIAGTQNTTSTIKGMVGNSNQNVANAKYDNLVDPVIPVPPNQLKGGSNLIAQGQTWGCYSGGKSRMKRNAKKTRKTKKTMKTKKTRKTKKRNNRKN